MSQKRILIFQQRGWGLRIGQHIAKELYDRGHKLAAFTFKREAHDYFLNQDKVKYDDITNIQLIEENPKVYLGDDDISIDEICDDLGIEHIWPLITPSRNHTKSYGDKYYYSFKQNTSDEEMVYFFKALYKYCKYIEEKFSPEIIIAPAFVSTPHLVCYYYFKRRNVKMLCGSDSKISGAQIFTLDYKDINTPLAERVEEIAKGAESKNIENAKRYIKESQDRLKQPAYMSDLNIDNFSIKQELYDFALLGYSILRRIFLKPVNQVKVIGPTIDNRSVKILIRDYLTDKRNKRITKNRKYDNLENYKKYVFYPLQFQPEASIDLVSPIYANQIDLARQIAISLPRDYCLVVKEHPAMVGLRSPGFHEKIARLPNVKLVDYRVNTLKILKGASCVISPYSTTLAEAAFFYTPAIMFSETGTTGMFPNVFKHQDISTLKDRFVEILSHEFNKAEYDKKLVEYISAAMDMTYSNALHLVWEGKSTQGLDGIVQGFVNEAERILEVN